jgi:N-dimethylarginine dimethylaminohydrolase
MLLCGRANMSIKKPTTTPSQHPFPVFTLCPPVYTETTIKNNVWMKEGEPIDKDKFLAQWYNLFNVLAGNSMVYLITPTKGLQDQVYVNCFAYLPHIKGKDVIILSNFTAEGRAGEEVIAGELLLDLGYTIYQCPYKFEGEPELKYLHDDIYLGGFGQRTDLRAHKWLEQNFRAKIIPILETDEKLYHLDCSVFPITRKDTLICTELISPETVKKIEKVTNVIPVSKNSAYQGICNSLAVEECIYNHSDLPYLHKTDDEYQKELKKNQEFEKICSKLGLELLYFDLSECAKSGAYLSCFVAHLNYRT